MATNKSMIDGQDGECAQHHEYFGAHEHMDRKHNPGHGYAPEHQRGAGHPAHHTKGKLPSQLNPNHGPHHIKGR